MLLRSAATCDDAPLWSVGGAREVHVRGGEHVGRWHGGSGAVKMRLWAGVKVHVYLHGVCTFSMLHKCMMWACM